MMRVGDAAQALAAEHRGADATFTSVGTDSRAVKPGELFIALRGPNFDGHQYIGAARAAGAVAAMVDSQGVALAPVDMPLIIVGDTHDALTQLASAWRGRHSGYGGPLLALTGSSGKTTVKEMLAAILREAAGEVVLATRGNLNNEIGVPLTLLELRKEHRYAVIEMGMNHAGEIGRLARLARPDVALINNAGRAHIEFLGSEEAIAHAKGEIFEGLSEGGVAVLNADDRYAGLWIKKINKNKHLRFGIEQPAEVSARYTLYPLHSEIALRTAAGVANVRLDAPGLHNVRNALAACAGATALKVPLATIAAGLARYGGVKGRLQRKTAQRGATVIDDTYNANPESMRAAIDVLAQVPGRRLLVLGDMGELGERAAACHSELGDYARSAGLERLYALGTHAAHAVSAFGAGAQHFASMDELAAQLLSELAPDLTVLIKGSRFMQMERAVAACTSESAAAHA